MRILILLLCLPSVAFALNVTLRVDGQHLRQIDADRVNIITSDDGILIDVRTEPKSSPTPPASPPPAPPPPEPTACNPRPSGVGISALDWRQPGSHSSYPLGLAGIRAFRFTTTSNPSYEGQVSTTFSSTNPTYRTVWISECPGSPIESAVQGCVASGNESALVRWTQNPSSRIPCKLDTKKTYFINVQNVNPSTGASTCRSNNCPFHMSIYTNQRP